jgi:nucleosome assembly protein 1-like 1
MATSIPVKEGDKTAPTPQNTPLNAAPITLGLSRPTVPDIAEGEGEDGEDNEIPPNLFSAAALASLSDSRLANLIGRSSGYIESLPTPVKRSVEGLKGVQSDFNALQAAYKRECWELEKKVRVDRQFYLRSR